MTKTKSKLFFFLLVFILLAPENVSNLEQENRIQPIQTQFSNQEAFQNLELNPDFGKIPLYFIPNRGQVDERALFYANASRYTLWLTEEGLVFDSTRRIKKESAEPKRLNPRDINNHEDYKYDRDVSRLVFVNANRSPEVIPVDVTEHKVNYFKGKDKSKWQSNIQTSSAVLYKELYPNIDLNVYGIEKQIEYDFVVKPGGDVSDISFEYSDVKKTKINKEGNLVIETKFGELEHTKPVCYQVLGGERVEVGAEFKKIENNTYGFRVKEYSKNYELIIDPLVMVYSTYLGGSGGEYGIDIEVDSEGAAYVTGDTWSTDFPTKNPIQGTYAGAIDIFITKINSSGSALIYSTYLGGSDQEVCGGIAVNSEGVAYVTGFTKSVDFPTKDPIQGRNAGSWDAFITKINSSGSALIYSTYLGGSGQDESYGIAVDSESAAYLTGRTHSVDFPTKNPIQGTYAGESDIFIAKVNSSGSAFIYSTYLGGSEREVGIGIAVNSEGAAYATGYTESVDFPTQNPIQGSYGGQGDIFIAKVNSSGSAFIYSTYLGGSAKDWCWGIAVDSEGAAYATGYTESVDFPTQNPIQGTNAGWVDIFIAKVNSSGSAFIYSTYLGGSERDWCWGIAVDSEGAAYATGYTESVDFPTQNPIQGTNAGWVDAFIIKVNASGNALIYSTYLGGSGDDYGGGIAVDSEGAVYVTGQTASVDFPTENPIQRTNAGERDIFIAKVNSSGSALIYSTYFGGSGEDGGGGTAVDSEGAVYVTGSTESYDFPTKNPIQENNAGVRDAFITKFDTSERIRIVSWNILNYPDLNGEPREEFFQSVLEYLAPDILVVQEMTSFYGVDQFLKNILKPISKKYKAANFFDGPDTDNALFYDKSKIKLQSRQQILTSFRDISEYSLKIKKGPGKGNKFKIYSVHFTEGLNASETNQRENEANILRAYLNGLSPNSLFMVCGTFNMTGSDEEAYKILTGDQIINIGRAKDPINKAGKWHDNKKSRLVHTESTRKSEFGGGVRGGLDDRFDMILISYSLDQDGKLIYKPGSYVIYGNDGKHFNKAINKPKNRVVSPEMAEALYEASDHLPVVINLVPQDESLTKDRLN